MTRRYLHHPDVSDAELADIYAVQDDETPTPAELADEPTWWPPKVVRADTPLLAALQAGAERGMG